MDDVAELRDWSRVLSPVNGKTPRPISMFYVYNLPRSDADQAIKLSDYSENDFGVSSKVESNDSSPEGDIDFVDDALLNTAPHNAIEQQLLRGDMVGLALMSGAILWSAMGAFG